MNLGDLPLNDMIQYALIAALFGAAFADRAAHRAYAKVLSAMYTDLVKQLQRIEASVARKDDAS